MNTKLITLRTFSLSYQNIYADNRVLRMNLVSELEEILDKESKIVIIEGKEGVGKTDILLQFSTKHNYDSITFFINPAFRTSYRQDFFMQDVGRQIYFYNNNKIPPEDIEITEGIFNKLIFDLTTKPGRKNKPVYFILDGLDQIERSDFELLKNTLQNLPWNTNNFYFLVSGAIEKLKELLPPLWLKNLKSLRIPRFTENETKLLFGTEDTMEFEEFILEIHKTWKGHPESLCQVKRIIEGGISHKDFIDKFDISEKNELLGIEWKRAKLEELNLQSPKLLIISILTFDDNLSSIQKLAGITSIQVNKIEELVDEVSFLVRNIDNISFVSISYRQYAKKSLMRFEKETNTILINYFNKSDDLDSILNLPTLFHKNNEWKNIIDLLTIDNLDLIISNSNSFYEIKKQINYGYKASTSIKNSFENVFRFSLHRSLLIGLQSSDSKKDAIKAYIVLDRQEDAFTLISNSVLKEDRFKMLLYFIQQSKIENKNVDAILINEVKELIKDIDTGYLRENIVDIAISLAYFLPHEAINVIEKSLGLKPENNSIEWLISIIGIIANKNKNNSEDEKLIIEKNNDAKYSFVDKFVKSIGFGINEVPKEEIVNEIKKIEKSSDQIFLMRKWIKHNYLKDGINEIIEFTLNLLTAESSTSKPSTESLYDIVFPIKYFNEKNIIESMVQRIEDLLLTINTPTIGRVKLEVAIIESLANINVESSNDRTILLTERINDLSDISIKFESYVHIYKMFKNIEEKKHINIDSLIIDEKFIKQELDNVFSKYLVSIADQHDEIEESLIILSEFDFRYSLYIAKSLNTAIRRDQAIITCLESYISKDFDKWVSDDIEYSLNIIVSTQEKSEALLAIFKSAYDQKDLVKNRKTIIINLLPRIDEVSGSIKKCLLLSLGIILLGLKPSKNHRYPPIYSKVIKKLEGFLLINFNRIMNPLEKIQMGYKLTSLVGNYNKELAEQYFNLAEDDRKTTIFQDATQVGSLIESIRIMIRIYSGLIKRRDYSYEKISYLINYVPSKESQIALWSELAVRINLIGNHTISNKIVTTIIIPTLDDFKKNREHDDFLELLKISASALHLSQSSTLILYLKLLKIEEKEAIIPSVFKVLLSNCYEADPFENFKSATHFSYQDATDYLDLLEYFETDERVYHYIKSFVKLAKYNPNIFTRMQKSELYQKLNTQIANKLPNKRSGIVHDGYFLSAAATIELFTINSNKSISNLNQITQKIPTINNTTDRALVYFNLAKEFDNKKRKIELIQLAFEESDMIPSLKERISMYEIGLEITIKVSVNLFNEYLTKFENELFNLDENEQYPTYKKLIDLAYKYDKNIAQRLISNLDTDPARKKLSEPANDHFNKLDLENSAQSDYAQVGRLKERIEKSNFAWNLLAQLNSDKRKGREIIETTSFLHSASTMPLFYSMPLFEFFIENVIKREDKDNLLLSFYESANYNALLCHNLICNISNKNSSTITNYANTSDNSIIISSGMYNESIDFIKNFVTGTGSKDIFIIDPYFSDKDMFFLKNLDDWCNKPTITILSSCEAPGSLQRDQYISEWKNHSYEPPPSTTFVRANNQNNKSPFHDRYLLLFDKKLGLRLGASINGLNGKKTFEISQMLATDVGSVYETIIKPLAIQRIRDHNNQLIKYELFDF